MHSQLAVVINISSGQGLSLSSDSFRDHLQTLFAIHHLEAEFYWVNLEQLTEVLNEICRRKFTTVVVGGGDGTLRTAASALSQTSITLGILPLGTFNHFSRTLGIPLILDEAVKVIAKGARILVDVAEVNGYTFINNASVGIYVRAVRLREMLRRRLGLPKMPAMVYALLAVLWRLPRLDLRLASLPTGFQSVRVPFVFIGNNPYTSKPLPLVRENGLAQGCLSVLFTPGVSRKSLIMMATKAFLRPIQQDPAFEERHVQELIIRSAKRRLYVALDGEVIALRSPLVFRTRPQALQVIGAEFHS
ncbi:diacylglycerol kinase catalytic region [Nitrosococcus halophilus Nc 4]|uniref:Diacylglycerol kinase catalytic region n=1 Tax=Nitrosococcus halophilus (strain Nc4) TaxID=472759 RepID=D5C1U7_NITHN|nr:diacylglycerol kinase family protein [Nitrosococcus halophilus]ADE14730.1 diacylglycerol kinase catalytic region [Nitrosococcus halophilus Nc 4]